MAGLGLAARRRIWLAAALAVAPALLLLQRYAPTATSFYPRCVFHLATGWHCPGCGTARCLHALLNGDLAQAAAYNVLTLAALPFLVVAGFRSGWAVLRGDPPPRRLLPLGLPAVLVVVVAAFWVLRNVPVHPFTLLAPHSLTPVSGPPDPSQPPPGAVDPE